jgi:uncharacterized glyoxalase superfamily protein PhnB
VSIPSSAPERFAGTTNLSLTVKDLPKSVAWYHGVVGFGIERAVERDGTPVFVVLKAGDVRVSLNQDDGKKGWERIKGLGFSISVWTNDDVDAIARDIKGNGGRLDSEPVDAPWGARYFRLTDPDGFHLAIMKRLV